MNIHKIFLSLLVCAAPASARLSSDEKDSSTVMRELMAKVDALESEVESLKQDNKKSRGLGAEDYADLTALLGEGIESASGGHYLHGLLYAIINEITAIKRCVGIAEHGEGEACWFGGPDIEAVFIAADDFVKVGLEGQTDAVLIEADEFIGIGNMAGEGARRRLTPQEDTRTIDIEFFSRQSIVSRSRVIRDSSFQRVGKSAENVIFTTPIPGLGAFVNGVKFPNNEDFGPANAVASSAAVDDTIDTEGWVNDWN